MLENELLTALTHADAAFPKGSIEWAMNNPGRALPVCRAVLSREVAWLSSHTTPKWRFAATYALQLVGFYRDTDAHSLLIQALGSRRCTEQLFEERLIHNLPAILWATSGQNAQALLELFHSAGHCSFSRSAAMDGLCVGYVNGYIPEATLLDALGTQLTALVRTFTPCRQSQPSEAEDLALLICGALVSLRATQWEQEIVKAYDCGLVRPGLFTRSQALTQLALADPDLLTWQHSSLNPLDLANWAVFRP